MKDRNYKDFYALLKRMEGADKEVIVDQYTGGRTSSLREMTDGEYIGMIESLNKRINNQEESATQQIILSKARSRVLRIMMEMGINTGDWGAIDAFCLQPRIAGKRFYPLTVDELDKLRNKLLSMRDKGYKHRARRTQSVALPPTTTQTPS